MTTTAPENPTPEPASREQADAPLPPAPARHTPGAARFAGEVVDEFRHVSWPSARQTAAYTLTVLAFLTFMVAVIGGADALIASTMLRLLG